MRRSDWEKNALMWFGSIKFASIKAILRRAVIKWPWWISSTEEQKESMYGWQTIQMAKRTWPFDSITIWALYLGFKGFLAKRAGNDQVKPFRSICSGTVRQLAVVVYLKLICLQRDGVFYHHWRLQGSKSTAVLVHIRFLVSMLELPGGPSPFLRSIFSRSLKWYISAKTFTIKGHARWARNGHETVTNSEVQGFPRIFWRFPNSCLIRKSVYSNLGLWEYRHVGIASTGPKYRPAREIVCHDGACGVIVQHRSGLLLN